MSFQIQSLAANKSSLSRGREELVGIRASWNRGRRKHCILRVSPAGSRCYGRAGVGGCRQRRVGTERAVVRQEGRIRVVRVRERWRILFDGLRRSGGDRSCARTTCLPRLECAHWEIEWDVESVAGSNGVARVLRDPAVGKAERVGPHRRGFDARHGRVPYLRTTL